jgi:2-polyprenyl-3-methyl-5-hydroxy-6-metoxy-1,4-benzoquinol methylase
MKKKFVKQPEGNYYNKYDSSNPIARLLVSNFLASFDQLVARTGARDVVEVGCGEGRLSVRMAQKGIRVHGIDVARSCIEKTLENARSFGVVIKATQVDIRNFKEVKPAELVVCCEVLEHLEQPDEALEAISKLSSNWVLLSVPNEPVWRILNLARGAYWGALGNTPGHVQHWTRRGFCKFVKSRFEVCEIVTPLPWTMILARKS